MYAEVYEEIAGWYWIALYEEKGPFPTMQDAKIDTHAYGYLIFYLDGAD